MVNQTACDRCGKNGASNYTFYYGKETGWPDYREPVYRPGLGMTGEVVHHYQIGGSQDVPICQSCVTRGRVIDVFKGIADLPILWFALAAAAFIVPAGIVQGNLPLAFGVIAAVLAGFGALFLFTSPKRLGEEMAIQSREESVRERGWGVFWTESNYAKLYPDLKRFGPLAR